MSAVPDFTVRHLNDLHRARPLLIAAMNRCAPFSEKFDAYNAAHCAVGEEIRTYRRMLAEDCSPWFDGSAFQ